MLEEKFKKQDQALQEIKPDSQQAFGSDDESKEQELDDESMQYSNSLAQLSPEPCDEGALAEYNSPSDTFLRQKAMREIYDRMPKQIPFKFYLLGLEGKLDHSVLGLSEEG